MTAAPELRPYQLEACAAVRAEWEKRATTPGPDPLLVMATGTGKTRTSAALIREVLDRGGRVVVLAHRSELLEAFAALFPGKAGIVQGSQNQPTKPLVCASVATLRNAARVAAILAAGPIDLIVVDEAHHLPSGTHAAAVEALRNPRTLLLGLTATPDREDGADLGALFEIVYDYGTVPAIRDGWLVPPYAAVARLPGFDAAACAGMDDEQLGAELLRAHVVEHTVAAVLAAHEAARLPDRTPGDTIRARAADRSMLVFTASVRQAELTAEALTAAGVPARHVAGNITKGDRRRLLAAFTAGKLRALVNPVVLTEGTDLPRADAVVLARPFGSWSLFVQAVGRGLRLHHPDWRPEWGLMNALHPEYARTGGKTGAFILDLAGATETHSLVAAPVLLSAPPCVHRWEPLPPPSKKARCAECGATVACAALLGPHDYDPATARCRTCDHPQCEASPVSRHLWQPLDDGTRNECCFCGVTSREPLASLVSGSRPNPALVNERVPPDAWLKLEFGVWALSIEDHGYLFAEHVSDGIRDLYWLPKGGRNARVIGKRVTQAEAAALTADIVQKAERFLDTRPVRASTRAYADKARAASVIEGATTEGAARRALRVAHARERWAAIRTPAAAEVAA
jgi:superfamily II DNA or RNA helicase